MSALHDLVTSRQWQVAVSHIQSLPDGDAADQIFYTDCYFPNRRRLGVAKTSTCVTGALSLKAASSSSTFWS